MLVATVILGNRPAAKEGLGVSRSLAGYFSALRRGLLRKNDESIFALAVDDYFAWGWSGEFVSRQAAGLGVL